MSSYKNLASYRYATQMDQLAAMLENRYDKLASLGGEARALGSIPDTLKHPACIMLFNCPNCPCSILASKILSIRKSVEENIKKASIESPSCNIKLLPSSLLHVPVCILRMEI